MSVAVSRCTTCLVEKPVTEFGPWSARPRGIVYRCRECYNAYSREVRWPKRKTQETYKAKHRKAQRRYAAKRPEVQRAHSLARNRKAELKQSECSECGATENLHMHHPDYSKPLEVVTLCVPCHERVHHR